MVSFIFFWPALGEPTQNELTENSPEKKLRSSIAHAVSVVAYCEWPEEWSDLFNILMNYLSSGNAGIIYGAMKVFSDICHEISDTQIPSIAPALIPKMYEIFSNERAFSNSTRGRAVQIFTIITETVVMLEQFDKNALRTYIEPFLPQFTEALIKTLVDPESDIGMKKSVLSALIVLVKNCRKRVWKWMPQILTPVWRIMTSSANLYVHQNVNTDSDGDGADPPVDSDGEVLSLDGLVLCVFDFISAVVESSKSRKLIKQGIRDLIYYIIQYMQITDEQTQIWSSNPDQFVEDEDEDSYAYSVRISGLDIILSLAKEYEYDDNSEEKVEFQRSFIQAIEKHFEESNQSRQQGNTNWWKPQEACLTALGSLSLHFTELFENEQNPLNYQIKQILDHVFSNRDESFPFLAGRSLWAAARYAPIMNENLIQNFLRSIVSCLNNQSPIIQISALRSAYNICVHLAEVKKEPLIRPYLDEILNSTMRICNEHSTEVLKLCLETITMLICIDRQFAAAALDRVAPLIMESFVANAQDPLMLDVSQDIFREFFKNDLCHKQCESKVLPTLIQILKQPNSNEDAQHLKPIALDVISIYVRHSPQPLSDVVLSQCFPIVAHTILSTVDETAMMQNGGEAIRSFVSRGANQLARFRDPESGLDGMSLVMRVCMHLLDTRVPEGCATFVGKLITSTIQRGAESLGDEKVHLLLRSVLSKLQKSESSTVIQSLILVFAHLMNHNLENVLEFLGSLPGPSGASSALEFVLTNWLNKQCSFYGVYESKVSVLALCKLLEHSIVSSGNESQNLNKIMVLGDPVVSNETGVKTRSRSASIPDQFTMIPCSVKILKLLLNELEHIHDDDDVDDDEDDDDSDDEDGIGNNSGFNNENMLNRLQAIGDSLEEIEEEEDSDDEDPDIQDDPISKINLEQHLIGFIRQFLTTPNASEFSTYLNENDRKLLANVANSDQSATPMM